jgi:hypothetical protein
MESQRSPWDSSWEKAANYCLPRKNNIGTKSVITGPGTNPASKLFDTTAIESCSILASGHASAITPAGTQWFAWEAPDDIKSDEADAWYHRAAERAGKILSAGNHYTCKNETFEDRSGFGISCMAAFENDKSVISFAAHPVGSFCVEEDAEGNVDTVFFGKLYTIRQLVQMFGEKAVMLAPKLAKSWEKYKQKGTAAEHFVIHANFPRLDYDPRKPLDPLKMRYASVWIGVDDKTVLRQSGMPELAYCVSRYLKRSGSGQMYGYSPFEQCEAAISDANKVKQIMQVVGQRKAVPSMLIPDYLMGNVDTRPGGRTIFKTGANAGELPREWLNEGNIKDLMDQLLDDREVIQRTYHTDLFKMFSQREKIMTAREVSELSAEKLMPFSPSFTRYTADDQVMQERIFSILFRAGVFGDWKKGEIPAAVMRPMGKKFATVPPPKVIYQSRIALAIRQAETAGADRAIERAIVVSQTNPEVMDNYDLDAYARDGARNDGAPESLLRPIEDRDKMRQARAEAIQQQQQLEQAQLAADAANKVGIQFPGQNAA